VDKKNPKIMTSKSAGERKVALKDSIKICAHELWRQTVLEMAFLAKVARFLAVFWKARGFSLSIEGELSDLQ
jgi:hypothetical protein